MTFLFMALGLALGASILRPLGDGLMDTSMWVAKVISPPDVEEDESSKQFLRMGQAALMDGWLSNIPFAGSLLFFSAILVSFFFHWWAPFIIVLFSAIVTVILKLFLRKSVAYDLPMLHHKMINRMANYSRDNDFERE